MLVRPLAVAFDVIETLMPLEPLRARLEEIDQPGHLLEPWFLRTLRDGIALSSTGEFQPFPVVAKQALHTATGHNIAEGDVDRVLAAFGDLPAHEDAEPAMRRLAENGVRIICLTNGSAETTAQFLHGAGLSRYVEGVVTVEHAGAWKPAAAVYRAAAQRLEVSQGEVALVAAHAWDCHGAKRAGCMTGWVSRFEQYYGNLFAPPDVDGADLTEVADRLLELPEE